jgi:hypothetical protein
MQSKRIAATAFIWLCKLSEIMAGIAVFQQQTNFSREWNGVAVGESTSELEEVIGFDREIGKWKDTFESEVLDMTTDQALSEDDEVPMPVCILRIVCKCVSTHSGAFCTSQELTIVYGQLFSCGFVSTIFVPFMARKLYHSRECRRSIAENERRLSSSRI